MINLLPLDTRQSYRYARRNRQLIKWVVTFAAALALLGVITVYGLFSLHQQSNGYASQVSSAQALLKANNLEKTQAQVKDISNSFNLVVKVLGREVLFSKLLQQIGSVIPNGVNLTGLDINQGDGAIDLVAKASSYDAATQLQANLTDPSNQIFAKADLENVGCNTSGQTKDPSHPCTITIRALFAPDNPFLFINNKELHR